MLPRNEVGSVAMFSASMLYMLVVVVGKLMRELLAA